MNDYMLDFYTINKFPMRQILSSPGSIFMQYFAGWIVRL